MLCNKCNQEMGHAPQDIHDMFFHRERDNCQLCHGFQGGVKGNENVVDGLVMCDYCSVLIDRYNELKKIG